MQEHQVTIGDSTFTLPNPFLVLATQNPIEQEGTYMLPEAQVDRFMLKVVIDYPTLEEEKLVIRENLQERMPVVHPVITANEILEARRVVKDVYIDDKIMQYIADIVFATRYPERYQLPELKQMITLVEVHVQVSILQKQVVPMLSSSIVVMLSLKMYAQLHMMFCVIELVCLTRQKQLILQQRRLLVRLSTKYRCLNLQLYS